MGAEHGGQRGLELGDLGGDVLVEQRGALDVRERDDEAVALIRNVTALIESNLPRKTDAHLRQGDVLGHRQVARPARRDHQVLLVPPRPQAPRAVLQSPACNENEIKALVTQ